MQLDARVERNTESVRALAALLREVIANPSAWDNDVAVRASLVSQGALAKLTQTNRGIRPSSINTIKRVASQSLPGGFEALDQLRRNALETLKKHTETSNNPTRRSKADLGEKLKNSELKNQLLRQDLLVLTTVVERCLSLARAYASAAKDPAIMAKFQKERRELLDMTSVLRSEYRIPIDE